MNGNAQISFIHPLAYLFLLNLAAKLVKLRQITKHFILNNVVLPSYSLLFAGKCLILQAKFMQQ